MKKKQVLLSGMRPTGPLHLGHLVGVLNNWAQLQQEFECFFMIADWHALMSEYRHPETISFYSIDNVRDWLAVGLNPGLCVIFKQSDVAEHLELFLALSFFSSLSWLERCPTYKEQIKQLKNKDILNYAFLGYPVLQAADILLYKAQKVPVGEDQLPHLEICRQLAQRANKILKKEFFLYPEPLLTEQPRLLGLDNRKMSKSYNNFIALSDSMQVIKKKVMHMITDPQKVKRTDKGHPDICNVFAYHRVFGKHYYCDYPQRIKQIEDNCRSGKLGCVECKTDLAALLWGIIEPIYKRREQFNDDYIKGILKDGSAKAKEVACATIKELKMMLGLI